MPGITSRHVSMPTHSLYRFDQFAVTRPWLPWRPGPWGSLVPIRLCGYIRKPHHGSVDPHNVWCICYSLQSRTDKVNNKNEPIRGPPISTGIDADWIQELASQISAKSIEPFLHNLPSLEMVPENIGRAVNKLGKFMKNSAIASFSKEENDPKVW